MVPNAITTKQVATTKGKTLVHAVPYGSSTTLTRAATNSMSSMEGLNAITTTSTATITALSASVLILVLVPLRLHSTAIGLSQPRVLMELTTNAIPLPK